ncbi:hypothetical protein GQ42DRAFT_164354 [Ramicandelaber brevisporus]|nr:hypothetical protein GQ42DRAFT_164354 [Ramicandelaber brevisporus]
MARFSFPRHRLGVLTIILATLISLANASIYFSIPSAGIEHNITTRNVFGDWNRDHVEYAAALVQVEFGLDCVPTIPADSSIVNKLPSTLPADRQPTATILLISPLVSLNASFCGSMRRAKVALTSERAAAISAVYGVPPVRGLLFGSNPLFHEVEFGNYDADMPDDIFNYRDPPYDIILFRSEMTMLKTLLGVTHNRTVIPVQYSHEAGPWTDYHFSTAQRVYTIFVYILYVPCLAFGAASIALNVYRDGPFTGIFIHIYYLAMMAVLVAAILMREGETRTNLASTFQYWIWVLGYLWNSIVIIRWANIMDQVARIPFYRTFILSWIAVTGTVNIVGCSLLIAGFYRYDFLGLFYKGFMIQTRAVPGFFLGEAIVAFYGAYRFNQRIHQVKVSEWTYLAVVRLNFLVCVTASAWIVFAAWLIITATPAFFFTIPGYAVRAWLMLLSQFMIFAAVMIMTRIQNDMPRHLRQKSHPSDKGLSQNSHTAIGSQPGKSDFDPTASGFAMNTLGSGSAGPAAMGSHGGRRGDPAFASEKDIDGYTSLWDDSRSGYAVNQSQHHLVPHDQRQPQQRFSFSDNATRSAFSPTMHATTTTTTTAATTTTTATGVGHNESPWLDAALTNHGTPEHFPSENPSSPAPLLNSQPPIPTSISQYRTYLQNQANIEKQHQQQSHPPYLPPQY